MSSTLKISTLVVLFFLTVPIIGACAENFANLITSQQGQPKANRLRLNARGLRGKPYLLGPLGEGASDLFDAGPLWRTDKFDCTTLVETVIALSNAVDQAHFESLMNQIRYKDAVVGFVSRNHFADADWIPNNVNAGFLDEITQQVMGDSEATPTATAVIDKKSWYARLEAKDIHVQGITENEKIRRLETLRSLGGGFMPIVAEVPYIPLQAILDPQKGPQILSRIPDGSVMNLVRSGKYIKEKAGTEMNISHQGLLIRDPRSGEVHLIHATPVSSLMRVVEVPLSTYLKKFSKSESVLGINILLVR